MSKNVVTLNSESKITQGLDQTSNVSNGTTFNGMWYHSIHCIWFSIKCSLVTLSLKRIVFEIFDL